MRPRVRPFHHRSSGTWSYMVDDGTHAAIVDAVLDYDAARARTSTASARALLDAVRDGGLRLQWILETHAHADHFSAGHWLKTQAPDATLAIGEGIRAVQSTFRDIYHLGDGFAADGSQFDHLFADGETFEVGSLQARVIATPGHTSDSCAYLVGDALFTGDSLFLPDSGTARCDFPGGDAATLYRSIQRLFELPDDTRVFVCHDYGKHADKGSAGGGIGREPACETTIAAQKAGNIHVRDGIDEAGYVAMRNARDATLAMPALMLPAVQVNIRGGALPDPEDDGHRYLKLPVDRF